LIIPTDSIGKNNRLRRENKKIGSNKERGMTENVYETLREILDAHPTGAPESDTFDEILRTLFSPEEAFLAIHMTFSPKPLETIASKAGIEAEDALKILEKMANRAIIFSREKSGKISYGLLPTIPGLFEFPFMRGNLTPELEKLGKLWDKYHRNGLGASFAGNPTPVARVIPVGHAMETSLRVHPYEEVKHLIDTVDFIGLGQCACRITLQHCDKPTETCLFFDAPARFLVERKYAREITRDEAYAVLNRAEEAGLVHTSTNTADRAGFICNCCRCCCVILKGRTELELPSAFATSGFLVEVKNDSCTGCGICADMRCPMGALEIKDDIVVVTPEKCIGCGLCVTACPVDALFLSRRGEPPEIPSTGQELLGKVLTEKGKIERFMGLMKS
jgi:Na+-translocating ferredoxin:NAD+ oxidoreductase subunit B